MSRKKRIKRKITKITVEENSLAAMPVNKRGFLILKERQDKQKGVETMKLENLVAYLAMKSDVPEVVKEELKDFVVEDFDSDALSQIFKEVGIELPKEVKVEKEVIDVVKVGDKEMKVSDLASSFEAIQKEFNEMQKELVKKELSGVVGEKKADELINKYYEKLSKEELFDLAKEISGLMKLAEDTKGDSGIDASIEVEKKINKELERIQKEEGITRTEAMVRLTEVRPDLINQMN